MGSISIIIEALPLQTFLYLSSGGYRYAIQLDTYLRVELLGHRICDCSVLLGTAKQFSKVIATIYSSLRVYTKPSSCIFSLTLSSFWHCHVSHLGDYVVELVVICIFLAHNCLSHFGLLLTKIL